MTDNRYDETVAVMEAMLRMGVVEKRTGKSKANDAFRSTAFGQRLTTGNYKLFLQLTDAAIDRDPEALNRFLAAHKAELDHFRD
jgi:hypothetical protein